MRNNFKFIFLLLIIPFFFLSGCNNEIDIGSPTKLNGRDPFQLLCEIQNEFKKLEKPVVKDVIYYEAWTEHRLGAGSYHHGRSYDIILTKGAYNFIKKYSRLEIRTALTPLIISPNNGSEVLALIDGMRIRVRKPVYGDRSPRYLSGDYSKLSPQKRMKRLLRSQAPPLSVYSKNIPSGTLEYEILKIFKAYIKIRSRIRSESKRIQTDWVTKQTIKSKALFSHPNEIFNLEPQYPIIGSEFNKYISSAEQPFKTCVLSSIADIYSLGFLLDLQQKYWVFYTTNWHFNGFSNSKKSSKYRDDLIVDIGAAIYSHCNCNK